MKGTHKKQKKQEEEDEQEPVDLTFCFQLETILDEQLKKLNYIGKYTVSNSKGAMAKIIGQQIKDKLEKQRELEEKFQKHIREKAVKTDLVDDVEIQKLNDKINFVADELKQSAYSIFKTLAENPDVPKNLAKAKTDQVCLIDDIKKMKDELKNGNFNNYNEIIKTIEANKFDIEKLRKEENDKYRELKRYNEEYAKEEMDFKKDKDEIERHLIKVKKDLADTKLEEKMYKTYQEGRINAEKNFFMSKFQGEENKLKGEIEKVEKQDESNKTIFNLYHDHLKNMKNYFDGQKVAWEAKRNHENAVKEKINTELLKQNEKQSKEINDLKNKINIYRAANEQLEKEASVLKVDNYNLIHNVKYKAEKEKLEKEKMEKELKEKEEAEKQKNDN